jgi:xanthosine utilization system XapX-like protein
MRKANLKLAMFDLGNNVDHACLRVIIPHEPACALVLNVSGMVGELITPTQVLVEEMAITSNCDDEGIASSKFESNFSI